MAVDLEDVEEFNDHVTMCPPAYSEELKDFALTIMDEFNLQFPQDVNTALELYIKLLKEVKKLTYPFYLWILL